MHACARCWFFDVKRELDNFLDPGVTHLFADQKMIRLEPFLPHNTIDLSHFNTEYD